VLHVPIYYGLNIEEILAKGNECDALVNYLPDERDIPKLPRQFVINVTHTVMGPPFKAWVDSKIKERNESIAEKQGLLIELDSEIYKAFQASHNISSKCYNNLFFIYVPSNVVL
jgi:hypothetical protein